MILAPILLTLVSPLASGAAAPAATLSAANDTQKQFVELAAKKDRDGCLALWKAHWGEVLPTIDADLEGSLKVREKSKDAPDVAKIAELHARAVWGAEIARDAGLPLVLDYATSFVGWDEAQRKRFREGQAAFSRAMSALKQNDAKTCLAAGQECLDRAAPLGDWWGTGMGWDAIAAARKSAGEHELALQAASNARLIYLAIGLEGDEYGALATMAESCEALGRPARGKACAERAIELAKKLGDKDGEKRHVALRDAFAQKLAVPAAAPKK